MEPIEYIRALRIWWWLIAATVFIGLAAAWITTPSSTTDYEATRTLKVDFSETELSENALDEVAFDVKSDGDVLEAAAASLSFEDNPTLLAELIETSIDATVDTLTITAVDRNPDDAQELVDAFATALEDEEAADAREARADAEAEVVRLTEQIQATQGLLDQNPEDSVLDAELQGFIEDRDLAEEEAQAPAPVTFERVQTLEPVAVSSGPGRVQRMGLAGLLGLLLGGGMALLFARFDPRIRTKEQAQRAFDLPVLAEIPVLPRRRRMLHEIVTVSDPESLAGQAYRSLRTSLILKPTSRPATGRKKMRLAFEDQLDREVSAPRPKVVVIISPGMGEGKTTTTANLAAAFGETGRRVLVLECDLRRPTIGSYLGVDEGPGLSDLLAQSSEGIRLGEFIRETSVPNVKVITAGRPVANPDELLSRVTSVIDTARLHADVVLVDTAPLLATDDASVLVPMADDVVVVCRAGRTPVDAAERASEMLTRFGAPVAGVTLVGATVLPSTRSYYRADHRFWQQGPRRQLRPIDRSPPTNGSEQHKPGEPKPSASQHTPGEPSEPQEPESQPTPGEPSEPQEPESQHTPGEPSAPQEPESGDER